MSSHNFTYNNHNLLQLENEIRASSITKALDSVVRISSTLTITFKDAISPSEETTLSNLVTNHIPLPDAKEIIITTPTALPDPDGFRYRGNATPWQTCTPGATNLDLTMPEELHIDGGTVIVENANPGDYCQFQVVHPLAGVVEQFVNKAFVIPGTGHMDVNVYRAKIPAGLIIRIVYNNVGSTDVKCGINLRLHKKV